MKILNKTPLELTWDAESFVEKINCKTSNDVARAVAKLFYPEIYGGSALETTEIDHWLTFALGPLTNKNDFPNSLDKLNKALGPVTYLVAKKITIADFIVFGSLYGKKGCIE